VCVATSNPRDVLHVLAWGIIRDIAEVPLCAPPSVAQWSLLHANPVPSSQRIIVIFGCNLWVGLRISHVIT
jgi:hypothetical protein